MPDPILRVLGRNVHEESTWKHGAPFFDAADVVVELESGPVVFGFRTSGYVNRISPSGEESWDGGYRPLAVTLDLRTVSHWDFNQTLWLGPDPHACLVWSNADAISLDGIRNLIDWTTVLSPADGHELPSPSMLGLSGWKDPPAR